MRTAKLTEEEKKQHAKEARKRYYEKTGYASQKAYRERKKQKVYSQANEYNRLHSKNLSIRFMLGDENGSGANERDIAAWNYLNEKENKAGYIKDLIIADMEKNGAI